jgi:hypothetical protein
MIDENLKQFGTERQNEFIDAIIKYGSYALPYISCLAIVKLDFNCTWRPFAKIKKFPHTKRH